MPPSSFFQNLGLFVREGFFNPETCTQLQSQMRLGEAEKGLVGGEEADTGILDEDVRKVLSVRVEASLENMVWDAISNLKPSLEEHFQVQLRKFEFPVFLRYGQGAFYRPHLDGDPETPAPTKVRRVSVVIFLNSQSEEPTPDSYGGGALTFYALLDGPLWEKCPFPLDAAPGLLVAFRSNVLHEVRPVTFGQRYTIVTWFGV